MSQHGYMAYLPVVEFPAGPSGVTSATQIRQMWPNANPAQKAGIVRDLYPKNPQAAQQILDKYLGTAMAEDSSAVDPTVIQMKKRARVAHPFAKSDEEALALYVSDRSRAADSDIRDQQERDEKIINRIDKAENKLEQEVARIDSILAQFNKSK